MHGGCFNDAQLTWQRYLQKRLSDYIPMHGEECACLSSPNAQAQIVSALSYWAGSLADCALQARLQIWPLHGSHPA